MALRRFVRACSFGAMSQMSHCGKFGGGDQLKHLPGKRVRGSLPFQPMQDPASAADGLFLNTTPLGETDLTNCRAQRTNTRGNPPAAAISVPGWHLGGAGLRLLGGLPSQQDESVGDRTAPAQVIMRTLKFLVKYLVAFGAEHIPQVAIRHQN